MVTTVVNVTIIKPSAKFEWWIEYANDFGFGSIHNTSLYRTGSVVSNDEAFRLFNMCSFFIYVFFPNVKLYK